MGEPIPIEQQLRGFRHDFEALRHELGKLVVGQEDALDGMLTAAVAGGHVLFEAAPGLGKTLLVQALAAAADLSFQRIQFTPELMPADLVGTYVVMETPQGRRTFEFQQGPIFANLVLADQINRGMPKTQSALLEAMEGPSITVWRETFSLPQPFLVMATQNPLEMEGTFPLPEPQLDRFFFKLLLRPPSIEQIEAILERTTEDAPPVISRIVDGPRLLQMRQVARNVIIPGGLRRAAAMLAAATHPDCEHAPEIVRRLVRYGCSPRGAQALVLGAKVRAASEARREVSVADLRAVTHAALRHRLILNFEAQADGVPPDRVIDDVLQTIPGLGPERQRST